MDRGLCIRRVRRALLAAAALLCVPAAGAAAATPPITEFSSGVSDAASLTAGPDGNVWFTDLGKIGRITPAGQITEFANPANPGMMPLSLVLGDDGNLWFTDGGTTRELGTITPAGQITESAAGLLAGTAPTELTAGPNGTLWFLDPGTSHVGRVITSTGAVTEFPYSAAAPSLDRIAAGPDGNIYFTDKGNVPGIGIVAPDGTITKAATTGAMSMPSELGGGPDGSVWFSDQESPNAIGRLPSGGSVTEFSTGLQANAAVDAVIAGPDGNVWFDDQYSTHPEVGTITPAGQITEFPTVGDPSSIVFGVDGNLWATEFGTQGIQRITPDTATMTTFTDGLDAGTDFNDADLIVGPDGNLWFSDRGTPKAIGRINVQSPPAATTGTAAAITSSSATVQGTVNPLGAPTAVTFQYGTTPALGSSAAAGSLAASGQASPVSAALSGLPPSATIYYQVTATNAYGTVPGAIKTFTTSAAVTTTTTRTTTTTTPPPPTTRTVTTTVGNQRVSLVAPVPTACTARTRKLGITLSAQPIAHSKAPRATFSRAGLFLDRGVRHTHTRRVKGKRRRIVTFTANATVRKLPAHPALKLSGLRAGKHTLSAKLVFARSAKGPPLRKTLSIGFRVC